MRRFKRTLSFLMAALLLLGNANISYAAELEPIPDDESGIVTVIDLHEECTCDECHEHEHVDEATLVEEETLVAETASAAPMLMSFYKPPTPKPCNHNWSKWTVSEASTCQNKGKETRSCSKCGASDSRDIPKVDCSPSDNFVKKDQKDSTCTKKGFYFKTPTCKWCDKELDEYKVKVDLPLADHAFGDWEVTKPATCTENGEETRYCANCKAKETRPIETSGHAFGEWEVTTPATCTENGEETRYCANCQTSETRPIEKTGHKFGEWTVTVEPTCKAAGTKERVCENCQHKEVLPVAKRQHEAADTPKIIPGKSATCTKDGYHYEVSVCKWCDKELSNPKYVKDPKTGHNFGEWTVTKPATCTKEGIETRKCQNAGCCEFETRAIKKLNHEAGEPTVVGKVDSTCKTKGGYWEVISCKNCKKELSKKWVELPLADHNMGDWTTVKAATCTTDGLAISKCKTPCCNHYETKPIKATGHNWSDWKTTKAATCTKNGEETRSCLNCGCCAKETRPIEATGHNFGDWKVVKPATCTKDGLEKRTCQNKGCCEFETRPIKATGHNFSDWKVVKPATCTKDGLETRACQNKGCCEFETRPIKATGHNFSDWKVVKPATCTKDGLETRACQNKGCCEFETRPIKATGHNFGDWKVTKPATCTTDGEETRYCTNKGCCEKETRPIAATGHKWSNWKVTTPATCGKDGVETRYCLNCGCKETETRPIPATGKHKFGNWKVVENATCTKEGKMERKCYVCGYKEEKSIPMTKHIGGLPVVENIKSSTCTKWGSYDSVTYCVCCHKELTRVTVPTMPLGHKNGCWEIDKESVVEPTCTEGGHYDMIIKCQRCGEVLCRMPYKTCPKGHKMGEWYETKAPSCTELGEERRDCQREGCEYFETRPVDMVAHTPSDEIFDEEAYIAPTCTKLGHAEYYTECTVCGKELSRRTEDVPMVDHVPGDEIFDEEAYVAPTCTKVGHAEYYVLCVNCGKELSRRKVDVPMVKHVPGEPKTENYSDPRCTTEGGYDTVVYCVNCGKELSRDHHVIPATGHNFGGDNDFTIENLVEATYEADGSYDKVWHCKNYGCNATKVEHVVIPKLIRQLPQTGTDVAIPIASAGSLLLVGFALVAANIKRRREAENEG